MALGNLGRSLFVVLLVYSSAFGLPFSYDRSVDVENFREVLAGPSQRPRIGLALSGGGARGFAQIGVLKALEELGVKVDALAGSSIGGVVGGLYACGYRPEDLERIVTGIDWGELFRDRPGRSTLFSTQKEGNESHFLSIRFEGLKPDIPLAVTTGQKVSNLFTDLTAAASLKAGFDFDRLPVPFRTLSVDLLSGDTVVFSSGDLAEALRATLGAPLAFVPLEKGERLLVDGGLLVPVPVGLAKTMGVDFVIAVNTSAPLLKVQELQTPLDVIDQATTILTLGRKKKELASADLVIEPELAGFRSMDFSAAARLFAIGYRAAMEKKGELLKLAQAPHPGDSFKIRVDGVEAPQELKTVFFAASDSVSVRGLTQRLDSLLATGRFLRLSASYNPARHRLAVRAVETPAVKEVAFTGNTVFPSQELAEAARLGTGEKLNFRRLAEAADALEGKYREGGYNLLELPQPVWNGSSGRLSFELREAKLERVALEGNRRTKSWVVMQNFPLRKGMLFSPEKVSRGVTDVYATGLFERVAALLEPGKEGPVLKLLLKEKNYEQVRLGAHYQTDWESEGFVDFLDGNLFGTGTEFKTHLQYGVRRQLYEAAFKTDRIFKTYLTSRLGIFLYRERWRSYSDFENFSPYRERRWGGFWSLGQQIYRLGTVSAEARAENFVYGNESYNGRLYKHRSLALRSVVDTRDKNPFPSRGAYNVVSFSVASEVLGGNLNYRKAYAFVSHFLPVGKILVFEPQVSAGLTSGSLPEPEAFRLGGKDFFAGSPKKGFLARQFLVVGGGLRARLWGRVYPSLRWDLEKRWTEAEEFDLRNFFYGILGELEVDTPFGPAGLGWAHSNRGGKKFYFSVGYDF
ncbi:MAG: patatin-like phospholipase family protein [candidate division Zixibacteria bacterium]|nr:patatin-like phospholipase family protein [candidate division Zixibacteria bacterium]MCI0596093.1 patatin-like phospholipase family protein [candidate division Zixibacteria bacterium]